MITDYTKIPFSWHELNTKLAGCTSKDDVKQALALEGINFTDLFNRIIYPIKSYDSDVLEEELFLNHVKRLYPIFQTNEESAFSELQQKIQLQSSCLRSSSTQTAEPSGPPTVKIYHFSPDYQQTPAFVSLEAYLDKSSILVKNPSKDRCELALFLHSKTQTSRLSSAIGLQFILSYLQAEKDYIQKALDFLARIEKLHEMDGRYQEGADRIVSLNPCQETRLYDVTEIIDEEFDFWVALSPYIDFRKIGERFFVYILPLFKGEHDKAAVLNYWQEVAKNHPHSKLREIASKLILGLEFNQMITNHSMQIRHFRSFIVNWMTLLHSYQPEDQLDVFLLYISPFCRLLDQRLSKFFCDGFKQERFQIFQIDAVREIKKIIGSWQDHQSYQESFYNYAFSMLEGIIAKSGKQKKLYLQYTKYLMGDSKYDLLPTNYQKTIKEEKRGTKQPKKGPIPSKRTTPKSFKPSQTTTSSSSLISPKSSCSSSSSSSESIFLPQSSYPQSLSTLPGTPFPFFLDKRVARWDEHPFGKPLTEEMFPEYWQLGLEQQELEHIFHYPHSLVDRFFYLGLDGTWKNHDRESERKVIPCEIAYKGKIYRGYLAYAIDKNTKICYHRYFSRQIDKDFLHQIIRKTFYQVDFPELQHIPRSKPAQEEKIVRWDSETTIQIHPIFGTIKIEDHSKSLKIKLFQAAIH